MSLPLYIVRNGKQYRVNEIHENCGGGTIGAEFEYKGKWYAVKNAAILRDLWRFISGKDYAPCASYET